MKGLKELRQLIKEEVRRVLLENTPSASDKKTINDIFEIPVETMEMLKKALERANKALRHRNLKELELIIVREYEKKTDNSIYVQKFYDVKIEGDVPELHDYEFIAKVEHTEEGNIINMNPRISPESLPAEFRSFDQKCDICKSNRERLNTFIVKNLKTNEYIVAGSGCLKKVLPLDTVKAFLEYSVQLEALRRSLAESESSIGNWTGDNSPKKYFIDAENFMYYVCLAYLAAGKKFVSRTKAQEWNTQATVDWAWNMAMDPGMFKSELDRFGNEAKNLVREVQNFIENFDFDWAMEKNPSMENYFQNLKVLSKMNSINVKNTGYYASFLGLYLRSLPQQNITPKENKFLGEIGEKITVEVKVISIRGFETAYGWTTLYNFETTAGNSICWFSSKEIKALEDIEKTDKLITITGTVKDHKLYNNKKQTYLTRVKIS